MSEQRVDNRETKVEQQVNVNAQAGATVIIGASSSTPTPAAPPEAPTYAFLSYAPVDTLLAMGLGRALLAAGVRPWLEIWDRGAGSDGDLRRREAMRDAAVLVVCSGQGRGSEPSEFAGRVLHVRMARSEAGALELELDDGATGIETLASRIGVDPDRKRWLELEAAALGVEPDALRPYRGLEAFKEQHARWMFGRDEELAKLVELAREQSLLTVIGASGSGKSSLVMGGLCPALRSGMLGERVTTIGYLRPGKRPCESLAEALVALGPPLDPVSRGMKVAELRDAMQRSPELLRVIARQLVDAAAPHKSVLVLDQLEELFTEARLGQDGESPEALPFVHNIVAATSGEDAPLWIVSTLRADFLPHCLGVAELARTLNAGTYFALPPMRKDQVREAVELPARRVGFEVEQGGVVELVKGAAEHAGRLPLLEHVLGELWERRNERTRTLTFGAYQAAGGLEGAIAAAAARGLATLRKQLGEQALPLTRRVMSRLVNIGETAQADTRRRASIDELGRDEQTRRMLDVFVREARVLVIDVFGGVELVEIAHEALLREWVQLREWLDADRQALRLRDAIGRAAKEYAVGKSREYLWGRARVEEARRVLAKSEVELDARERGFLDASGRAAWTRRVAVFGAVGSVIGVLGAMLLYSLEKAEEASNRATAEVKSREWAEQNEAKAKQNEKLAEQKTKEAEEAVAAQKGFRASMMVSEGGPYFDAAVLALEAVGAFGPDPAHPPTPPAFEGLLAVMASEPAFELFTLSGHSDIVTGVAFSSDGTLLATSSIDNTARVWDVASGKVLSTLSGHSNSVTGVAFSPDGTRIATSSWDNTARMWDVASGKLISTISGHSNSVTGVAFSPDGTRIATSSADNSARVWDVASGKVIATLSGHSDKITGVAFSPDGTRIATSSWDATARLWDVPSGKLLSTLAGHESIVTAVAFSPDAARIATSTWYTARVWDAASGKLISKLSCSSNWVTGVAFSPDSTDLTTSSSDNTARVWDVASGKLISTLSGHSDGVTRVAFSPDATRIATSSRDNTARVWDVASVKPLSTLSGHEHAIRGVSFSPDGSRIATSSADNTARVWDVASNKALSILSGHESYVSGVAFSPDGAILATSSADKTARLWDVPSGKLLSTLYGHSDYVTDVAFSPDGMRLATSSDDRTTRVWDVPSSKLLSTLSGHSDYVTDVAFSPEGTRIATSSFDKTARVWDAVSGKLLYTLSGHSEAVTGVAFSPDCTRLVTSSNDETARVWDVVSGKFLYTLSGHSDFVTDVALSPDGTRIATSSSDKTARLWDMTSGKLLATLTGHSEEISALAFSPEGTRLATVSNDNTAIIHVMSPLALCNRLRHAVRYPEIADICATYEPL